MFSRTYGAAIHGIDAIRIQVEADISDGLPGFDLVGFLASEVREAKERVRVAIRNTGIMLPPKKITVNLSPADVRKEGTAFDLPIAIAILTASGHLSQEHLENMLFAGELSLNGDLNPIGGILPIACCAKENEMQELIVPMQNAAEGAVIKNIKVWGCKSLEETIGLLMGKAPEQAVYPVIKQESEQPDFKDVCGQLAAKRAIEVAAAGGHNILFTGSPGSGKTMLAKRIPSIMPELLPEESLELSKIYSVSGKMAGTKGLIKNRPFRAPHHSITTTAMAGGGRKPQPGEISLASHGVLFLDEFPEFNIKTIELLRQPLEERKITVSRVAASCDYPASFIMAAAMNPCPCGMYPDRNRCRCTLPQIRRYQSRISRPILDRIDMFLWIPSISYEELEDKGERESSKTIRERVVQARNIQKQRYKNLPIHTNAELTVNLLKEFCPLGSKQKSLMRDAFHKYRLSARAYHRIIKVARTIADLNGAEEISAAHLCEAASYRKWEPD